VSAKITLDGPHIDRAIMYWLRAHDIKLYSQAQKYGYEVVVHPDESGTISWTIIIAPKPESDATVP